MIETFTRLQCVERQREIESMPKPERKQHAAELQSIAERLAAIRAENKANPPVPKTNPLKPEPLPPAAAGVEVIVLRRSRVPSMPPEAIAPIRAKQSPTFTDLRSELQSATRRNNYR